MMEKLAEYLRQKTNSDGVIVVYVNPNGSGCIVTQPIVRGSSLQLADELEKLAEMLRSS